MFSDNWRFSDGSGFLGDIARGNNQVGGGKATLNPIAFNPTMLFMAVALMNIGVQTFIDNINMMNVLYNEPIDLVFDKENIYVELAD